MSRVGEMTTTLVRHWPNMSLRQSETFWDKVDLLAPNGCWVWTGARTGGGYGHLQTGGVDGKSRGAHVVAYELLRGVIEEGLQLDHLCRNRACVNPAHLEPVTASQNMRRAIRMKPTDTHCIYGHEMTEENTGWATSQRGHKPFRKCLTCAKKRNREWRRKSIRTSGHNRIEAT